MRTKKGISLIVLVITIIVMLILAGAIIITLSNTNIINKATEAVDRTNVGQVQTLANTAFVNAYAKGNRAVADLKDEIVKELNKSGISEEDYYVIVTPSDVTIKSKKTWTPEWTQDGTTITNGKITLEVGDYVDYKAGVSGYSDENGWRVLGAENGQVLLLSTNVIGSLELGAEISRDGLSEQEARKEAKFDWKTAVEQLDNVCKSFGNGTHAKYARSLNLEDAYRIAKLDRQARSNESVNSYGNILTFEWRERLYYCFNNERYGINNLHYGFCEMYDSETGIWRKVSISKNATEENPIDAVYEGTTIKVKQTITASRYEIFDYIDEENPAFDMLGGYDEIEIWMADSMVMVSYEINYAISTNQSNTMGRPIINSIGKTYVSTKNVKAVIVLQDNVDFIPGDNDGSWKITNK